MHQQHKARIQVGWSRIWKFRSLQLACERRRQWLKHPQERARRCPPRPAKPRADPAEIRTWEVQSDSCSIVSHQATLSRQCTIALAGDVRFFIAPDTLTDNVVSGGAVDGLMAAPKDSQTNRL